MKELRHAAFGSVGEKRVESKEEPKLTEVDLRSLIELGCVKDTVDIGGMKFTLRSLNASEKLYLSNILKPEDENDSTKLFEFQIMVLSLSVESINGKLLEELHSNFPHIDAMDAKKEILSNMYMSVLASLLAFYKEISDRADNQFTIEQVKN